MIAGVCSETLLFKFFQNFCFDLMFYSLHYNYKRRRRVNRKVGITPREHLLKVNVEESQTHTLWP